ncbi:transcriptional regulator [Burkholderia contaminans]|nr:transcriptional regulator [Burkholderia contaminans]VWC61851.1 transcriptional regulator [Burkholderia contaminans]VWC72211.1 transcriptional regulator [Burkholderia contaminans]VWD54872.1 transcriptional regulator [Burkholderia contaminans]
MHVRTARAHSNIIKIKMHNKQIHQYNGYAVQPSAHRLPDGSFSSNLLLERAGSARSEGRYQFYSLDYFASEEQALQHSARWARNWVDTRG